MARARYPAFMKRAISLLAVLLFLSRSHAGECAIEVEAGVWNGASVADVHAVLASAQDEVWKHCDGLEAPGVKVVFNRGYPITFDQRLPDGRVRIGLDTGGTYWSQFSFQYAHEFAHLIAGHTRPDGAWTGAGNPNGWLEETLCETASLFALRAMSRTWRESPPYPNWRDYSSSLADYARDRLDDPKHQLPAGTTFPQWLDQHLPELRRDCCNRESNTLVAARLLPVFEEHPAAWKTLAWFRHSKAGPDAPVDAHLAGWRDACPPELQPHVERIAKALGRTL